MKIVQRSYCQDLYAPSYRCAMKNALNKARSAVNNNKLKTVQFSILLQFVSATAAYLIAYENKLTIDDTRWPYLKYISLQAQNTGADSAFVVSGTQTHFSGVEVFSLY